METLETTKRQTRKVGVAGGFINQLMGNNTSVPVVGQGATELSYSDRHAFEVIWVSEDGLQCKIREMDTKWVGSAYGDERYEYISNPDNYTKTLEWNGKKGCWGQIYQSIAIIKTLHNKLIQEHGFSWSSNLPNGVKYDDLVDGEYAGCYTKLKLVEGITKEYKVFSKISIIFGVMEEYRDPTF